MPTKTTRQRLLVRTLGAAAGHPLTLETLAPIFPGADMGDPAQDTWRAAWSGGIGGFVYTANPAGSGPRVGAGSSPAPRVFLASRSRGPRVTPGDQLQVGGRVWRVNAAAALVVGVEWTHADGSTTTDTVAIASPALPAGGWWDLVGVLEVPPTARRAAPFVDAPGGWYVELGAESITLASRESIDVGTITIRRSRESIDAAPAPATMSTTLPLTGSPLVGRGDLVTVTVDPGLGDTYGGEPSTRFIGNATDADLEIGAPGAVNTLDLVAVDPLARLARVDIGDTPWPVETAGSRGERILMLAAAADPLLDVVATTQFGVSPANPNVLARDVDRQPAIGLLSELIESAGGALVARRSGQLEYLTRESAAANAAYPKVTLDAGALGLAPIQLTQSDPANLVRVEYGNANPQAAVEVRDQASIDARGLVQLKRATQLADATGAKALADSLLARGSRVAWQLEKLTVDLLQLFQLGADDPLDPLRLVLVDLLNLEPGDVVELVNLPAATPELPGAGWFAVQGWTEVISPTTWRLTLDLVDYTAAGAPQSWYELPADVGWADLPADVTWAQLGAARRI